MRPRTVLLVMVAGLAGGCAIVFPPPPCGGDQRIGLVAPGRYVPSAGTEARFPPDFTLEIAADGGRVLVRYTSGAKAYEVEYAVISRVVEPIR